MKNPGFSLESQFKGFEKALQTQRRLHNCYRAFAAGPRNSVSSWPENRRNVVPAFSLFFGETGDFPMTKVVSIRMPSVLERAIRRHAPHPSGPNLAIKALWPSTNVWRQFVALAARISPDAATELIDQVPDSEIDAFLRVALATEASAA